MLTTVSKFHSDVPRDYLILRDMCHSAKNIRNSILYIIRQHFFATGKYLGYQPAYEKFRDEHPNLYYQLNSWVSQNVVKNVADDFSSFFALLKKKKKGEYDRKVCIPKYQRNSGLRRLKFGGPALQIKDGYARLALSKWLEKKYGKKFLRVKIPPNIEGQIKDVQILPKGERCFEVAFAYEEKPIEKPEDLTDYLSCDLGVGNFVATVTSNGTAKLLSGKKIKSYNQLYNKEKSKLQSLIDTAKSKIEKMRLRRKMNALTLKRNRRVKDFLHKASKALILLALENKVKTIVFGLNKGWKDGVDIGRKNNQTFTNLPHSRFIDIVRYKAARLGIKVETIEESHTSKCDAMSREEIRHQEKYLGKRIKRGLFKSATGVVINSDVNGALNILRRFLECNGESNLLGWIATSGHLVLCPAQLALGTYGSPIGERKATSSNFVRN